VTANSIFPTSDRAYGFDKFKIPVTSIDENGETADPLWGEDGFTFGDLIDLINPLHHIPGVATLYRELTGDQISPGTRLIGGSLFGGILRAVSPLINVVVEDSTGKDIGEHVVALFSDANAPEPKGTLVMPSFASTEDGLLAQEPYQTTTLTFPPSIENSPANLANAASGNEPLHMAIRTSVLNGDWHQSTAFAPLGKANSPSMLDAFRENSSIGGMKSITQDGVDVSAVLKLYETYQQRARLSNQSQPPQRHQIGRQLAGPISGALFVLPISAQWSDLAATV